MRYRPEIDGLRAVAVIPVILFHAGFTLFSGGFVGVDIFFVISGYLITTILIEDLEQNNFNVIRFYERRARRILPALFVVLVVCLPFAWFILFPHDLKEFADSLITVVSFVSNVYYWRTSQYFDTASELKPLLHTWSLAVEEQYYLFFPIILWFTWRLKPFWRWTLFIFIAVLSLSAAQWGAHNTPTLNWYILPTRFWELLIGSFTALYLAKHLSQDEVGGYRQKIFGVVGLALILYSIFVFDDQTPFPSLYTLVPTIGAALIIANSGYRVGVGKLLGNKLLVGLGLVSYSAYLWHQPLFAFTRQYFVEEPGAHVFLGLSLLSFVFAYFSWRFVETPFRKSKYERKAVFLFSLSGILLFIIIGLSFPYLKKMEPLTEDERLIYSFMEHPGNGIKEGCFLDSTSQSPSNFPSECRALGVQHPKIFIWGDSHAAHLAIGLRELQPNLGQYTSSHCPPITGQERVTAKFCGEINSFVLEEIKNDRPDVIILDAYWYSYGPARLSSLANTVAQIKRNSPSSQVVIVGNAPYWPGDLPLLLVKHKIDFNDHVDMKLPSYIEIKKNDEMLKSAARTNGVLFVSALDVFCKGDLCRVSFSNNGHLSLSTIDYGHLTEAASINLATKVLSASAPLSR